MTLTPDEFEKLKIIGRIVAQTLQTMTAAVQPGMTTLELDELGLRLLREAGATPAPPTVYGFPGATCISISPVAAHGIPDAGKVIQPGDIVNIDVSASLDGIFADNGGSVAVPPVSAETEKLLATARLARDLAIAEARAGRPVNNIGRAAERAGAQVRVQDCQSAGQPRCWSHVARRPGQHFQLLPLLRPADFAGWLGTGDRTLCHPGFGGYI